MSLSVYSMQIFSCKAGRISNFFTCVRSVVKASEGKIQFSHVFLKSLFTMPSERMDGEGLSSPSFFPEEVFYPNEVVISFVQWSPLLYY